MKFVVSTKSGKAYSASSENALFMGKKIGETVKLDEIGLTGFEATITGGSDKDGFPMNKSVPGTIRKKIFASSGVGVNTDHKGERKRISVRGTTIGTETSQVNLKVTKEGSVKIANVLGKGEASEEETMSAKERAIKKSLELAGSAEIGDAPTKKNRH
jgi:small subunit ribosomal protein S6e